MHINHQCVCKSSCLPVKIQLVVCALVIPFFFFIRALIAQPAVQVPSISSLYLTRVWSWVLVQCGKQYKWLDETYRCTAWISFQQELLGITIHPNFCNSTRATVSKQSKQRQHVRFYYTIDLPCLCISCSIICTVCHVTYILKAVYSKLGHNLATELPQWVKLLTAIHLSHEHDKNNDPDTFSSKLRTCWSECACLSMNIWPDKFLKRTCNNGHTIKGSIY